MTRPASTRTIGDVAAAFVSGVVCGVAASVFVATSPETPVASLPFLVTAFIAMLVFIYALASPP